MTRRIQGLIILGCVAFVLAPAAQAQLDHINLEIDYMVFTGNPTHTHRPQPGEIAAIKRMFECHGITLNVVVDDAIPHIIAMQTDDPSDNFFTGAGAKSFKEIKDTWFDNTTGNWHYCVFGHQYALDGTTTSSSGLAEQPGDDLVVTLGTFPGKTGTAFDRAATLAHELGHNLGLGHQPLDEPATDNNSLIYASVMSYRYQLTGVRNSLSSLAVIGDENLFKEIDYSNGRLPTVVETALLEEVGLGITRVDWDCDGVIETSPVFAELDTDTSSDSEFCDETLVLPLSLSDQDDWSIVLSSSKSVSDGSKSQYEPCATPTDRFEREVGADSVSQPALHVEECVSGEMIWVDTGGTPLGSGTGDNPISVLTFAVSAAPPGSILYLQPGTYTNSDTPLEINKKLTLAGPGSAVVDP